MLTLVLGTMSCGAARERSYHCILPCILSRLCSILQVEVETVATTLALGEQNHAAELKRVCLEFVSRNLGAVMQSEGYQHMIRSCPQLQVPHAFEDNVQS